MKKILSLILTICIIASLGITFPLTVNAAANGTCGKALEWVLDDNGVLTISGTGEMFKYHFINESENGGLHHTSIPPWYEYRDNIKYIKISEGVTSISDCAFYQCENVISVDMSETVEKIGYAAFEDCKKMKSISLSQRIKQINDSTFLGCESISKIVIPHGVKRIETLVFGGCTNLKAIYFPDTVQYISDWQGSCSPTYVFYGGTETTWNKVFVSDSGWNYEIDDAKVYYNASIEDIMNLVTVYLNSNIISFEQPATIKNGRTLVPLRAIFEAMGATVDWNDSTKTVTSKLGSTTIQLTIGSNILYKNGTAVALDVPAQLINGYTMVPARAVAEAFGADVDWDGDTQTVYITTKGNTYSVNSVPQITYDGYNANFVDFNGMYIDSFTHSTNSNGTENVKFDVYNTQYIYGLVEIYNANDVLTDVAIIDKMSNSTSIKGVLIDDTGSLIRDIWNGTALTYRQESGYSKKTSINIDIPKGGYIKITNDMSESFIASAINLSDMVFAAKSTFSTLSGFNSETSKDFVYELSLKLINETAFAEAIKTPEKFTEKLWKGVGEELYMNSESVGGFLDTVSKNLDEFADGELAELMISTAANCGIGIAEGTFEALAGPAGVALKAMFTITSVTDVLIEMNDGLDCLYQGSIKIKTA